MGAFTFKSDIYIIATFLMGAAPKLEPTRKPQCISAFLKGRFHFESAMLSMVWYRKSSNCSRLQKGDKYVFRLRRYGADKPLFDILRTVKLKIYSCFLISSTFL